jgi:hypothetical protein
VVQSTRRSDSTPSSQSELTLPAFAPSAPIGFEFTGTAAILGRLPSGYDAISHARWQKSSQVGP